MSSRCRHNVVQSWDGEDVPPKLVLCMSVNTRHGHGEHAALLESSFTESSLGKGGDPQLSLELPFAAGEELLLLCQVNSFKACGVFVIFSQVGCLGFGLVKCFKLFVGVCDGVFYVDAC